MENILIIMLWSVNGWHGKNVCRFQFPTKIYIRKVFFLIRFFFGFWNHINLLVNTSWTKEFYWIFTYIFLWKKKLFNRGNMEESKRDFRFCFPTEINDSETFLTNNNNLLILLDETIRSFWVRFPTMKSRQFFIAKIAVVFISSSIN